jgi:hypothetical protein
MLDAMVIRSSTSPWRLALSPSIDRGQGLTGQCVAGKKRRRQHLPTLRPQEQRTCGQT